MGRTERADIDLTRLLDIAYVNAQLRVAPAEDDNVIAERQCDLVAIALAADKSHSTLAAPLPESTNASSTVQTARSLEAEIAGTMLLTALEYADPDDDLLAVALVRYSVFYMSCKVSNNALRQRLFSPFFMSLVRVSHFQIDCASSSLWAAKYMHFCFTHSHSTQTDLHYNQTFIILQINSG